MVVLGRLQDFDFSLYEAALDLGANKFQAFFKVVIPAIMPGILAGALLSPVSTCQGESIPSICHAVCLSAQR